MYTIGQHMFVKPNIRIISNKIPHTLVHELCLESKPCHFTNKRFPRRFNTFFH